MAIDFPDGRANENPTQSSDQMNEMLSVNGVDKDASSISLTFMSELKEDNTRLHTRLRVVEDLVKSAALPEMRFAIKEHRLQQKEEIAKLQANFERRLCVVEESMSGTSLLELFTTMQQHKLEQQLDLANLKAHVDSKLCAMSEVRILPEHAAEKTGEISTQLTHFDERLSALEDSINRAPLLHTSKIFQQEGLTSKASLEGRSNNLDETVKTSCSLEKGAIAHQQNAGTNGGEPRLETIFEDQTLDHSSPSKALESLVQKVVDQEVTVANLRATFEKRIGCAEGNIDLITSILGRLDVK